MRTALIEWDDHADGLEGVGDPEIPEKEGGGPDRGDAEDCEKAARTATVAARISQRRGQNRIGYESESEHS